MAEQPKAEKTGSEPTSEKAEDIKVTETQSEAASGGLTRLADIEREVERAFGNFFSRGWAHPSQWDLPALPSFADLPSFKDAFEGKTPKVNVIDRDDEVVVEAELPGVAKDQIEVSINDNRVTIKASTKKEQESDEGQYHRREISSGYFSRTVTLPSVVKDSAAKAEFKDGLLTLTVPKSEESRRRKIEVT